MKKSIIIIIAAIATIACAKEAAILDNNLTPKDGKLSFEVTIAPFVDEATKASIGINGETGAITGQFSWSEGDQIAFPVTGDPAYVALTYNTSSGKFEGTMGDEQEIDKGRKIYYPASRYVAPAYSTDFASIDKARAGFKMVADVPASLGSTITMTHESALVHVQFTNVPDFADELVVNDGSSNVATIPASEGTVDFYVPVTPAGSKTYSFSIKDGSNVIKSVSKTISLDAGKYYNTPSVSIGHIIRIVDSVDWGSRELYIWNAANTLENKCFTTGSEYPYQLLTSSANDHYIVVPSELSWANTNNKIGVKFQDAGASHSTQTDGVYFLRDITFTVPAGLGMQTDYRIYPRSSSKTSLSLFVTKPIDLITSSSDGSWSDYEVYWWSNKTGSKVEPWGNWDTRKGTRLSIGTQIIPSSLVGYATDSGIIIGDLNSGLDQYKPQLNTCFYGDIYADLTSSKVTLTEDLDSKRISDYWPGTTISPIASSINEAAYFRFDNSYYGNQVWIIISDDGSAQKPVWDITINQDYDYNF